jgi:large subunit ribosomal protein L24
MAKRPSTLKIRRDDQVVVISGKDRGKTGRVLKVDPDAQRVIVEGLNLMTKHTRPRAGGSGTDPGGIEQMPAPIHISNVMLLDPSDNKPTRVGIVREDGVRYRVARRTGNRID